MTREERNELLADLRAAGVRQAAFGENGGIKHVDFWPPPAEKPAPAAPDADRPLPKPKRTLDEKLLDPLGIGKKPGGEG